MGASKTNLFTKEQNQLAALAKALAHPARVAIVQHLLHKGCQCSEIVEEIGLAQATISQHLKVLKSAGVIQGEIQGAAVCYCVNPAAFETLAAFIAEKVPNCC